MCVARRPLAWYISWSARRIRSAASARALGLPVGEVPQPQADDPNVHPCRPRFQARIFDGPLEVLDRFAKAFGDGVRLVVLVELGDQKTELIAAEARVQVLAANWTLPGDDIVGPDVFPEQLRHAFDDPIADRVAKRILDHLNPVMSTRPTAYQVPRCR